MELLSSLSEHHAVDVAVTDDDTATTVHVSTPDEEWISTAWDCADLTAALKATGRSKANVIFSGNEEISPLSYRIELGYETRRHLRSAPKRVFERQLYRQW